MPEEIFLRIGIFGGTFNPIHFGHLRTVEDVADTFKFDSIYFVLSKIPPHKFKRELTPAEERFKLLKLALKGNHKFIPSDIEIRRSNVSYTVDTVKYFNKKFPNDELFFIIGSDSFLEIETWFSYAEILKLINIVVMSREGFKYDTPLIEKLGYKPLNNFAINISNKRIYFTNVTRLDISSSLIRKNLKDGLSIKYFMPERCAEYIYKKNLYLGIGEYGE